MTKEERIVCIYDRARGRDGDGERIPAAASLTV